MAVPDWMTIKDPAPVPAAPAAGGQPKVPTGAGEKQVPGWMVQKEIVPGSGTAQSGASVVEDIKNIAPGAARTGMELLPAGPWEASQGAPWLVRKVLSALNEMGLVVGGEETLKQFDQSVSQFNPEKGPFGLEKNPFSLEGVRHYITDPLFGEHREVPAQTFPGKVVKTGLEVGPSILTGPGTAAQKLLMLGTTPLGAEGAGAVAERLGLPPGAVEFAKVAGGLAGATAPSTYNRLANARPIPPSLKPHIDIMKARKVPLSAGQITGDERLLTRESVAGGTRAQEAQGQEFVRAAAEEQGGFPAGTNAFTRQAMRTELDRMGAEFDRLTAGAATPFDNQLQTNLLDTTVAYTENNPLVAPVVESTMNDLAANAAQNGGVITGQGYANTRTRINELIRNENTDSGVRSAMIDFQDALDDAMGRNMPPDDAAAFRRVRAQYRNFLPIERAKASGSGKATQGIISPSQLYTGIKGTQGRREVAAGQGGMTELAEAGKATMEKVPNSYTANRLRAQLAGIMPLLAAGASGGLSWLKDVSPGAAAAIAGGTGIATAAFPALRDAFTVSDIGQKILARQGPRVPVDRGVLAGLVAAAKLTEQARQAEEHRNRRFDGGPH